MILGHFYNPPMQLEPFLLYHAHHQIELYHNVLLLLLVVHLELPHKEFQADLRLIPLGGCDVVLGIQWIVELGPILLDLKNLRMEFIVDGRKFILRGVTIGRKKLVSTDQIQKDSRHMSQASTIQNFSIQWDEENKVEKEQ